MAIQPICLSELLAKSGASCGASGNVGDPGINDIVYDSRKATPGALYVAIPGTKVHGDQFINDAVAQGAVAVLSENALTKCAVPWVQAKDLRLLLGKLAAVLWNVPKGTFIMTGITGTNGKTTTAHLLEAVFTEVYKKDTVWMFGTIDYHLGTMRTESTHTTPEALDILRFVGTAVVKPEAVVMEVSSHALALDRVGGCSFDLAVFTNLTQDHLDFHQNMESYFAAKLRLFTEYLASDGNAIVNIDDAYGRKIVESLGGRRCVTYGRSNDARVRITEWKCTWDGGMITVSYCGATYSFRSQLRGFFNIYNMAACIAGGFSRGIPAATLQHAFDKVACVNGRMERLLPQAPFAVVVDYAHTPDALVNVLRTAKELTRGRLLCVFGCGGDRDRKKRPLMAAAVADWCDEAWVTSDNPRSEEPKAIIQEIAEGMPLDFPYQTQPDRRKAIAAAMREARQDDCLVIAGKGHETYQEIQGIKHHFDDKEVACEIYDLLLKEKNSHGA